MGLRFAYGVMVMALALMMATGSISDFFEWANKLGNVEQGLLVGGVLGLGGVFWTLACLVASWLKSPSRYRQWSDLASQFYDIAERDHAVQLPTDKKKVAVTDHFRQLKFIGGTQHHHASETEALSRTAGKLLKRSKVRHRWYCWGCDPVRRWVEFVTESIKKTNPEFTKANIHNGNDGDKDRYFHFDVFPFAAHLSCKYCASFERVPKP